MNTSATSLEAMCQAAGVSRKVYLALMSKSNRFECEKHTPIYRAGQVNDSLYYVESGLLYGHYELDGDLITSFFLPEGAIGCSVLSYFNTPPSPSPESLTALEHSVVYALHKDELAALYERHVELYRLTELIMRNYLMVYELRARLLRIYRTIDRYEEFLKLYPTLSNRVSIKLLASYLAVHPDHLSRARGLQKKA